MQAGVRRAGAPGTRSIKLPRLRVLERAELIAFARLHEKLVVVLTPLGKRVLADLNDRRRARLDKGAPVPWWLG